MLGSLFAPWIDRSLIEGPEVGAPDGQRFLNLAPFSAYGSRWPNAEAWLEECNDKISWGPELCVAQPGSVLQHTVRTALERGIPLDRFDPARIRDGMVAVHLRGLAAGCRFLDQWEVLDGHRPGDWILANAPHPSWEHGLISRYGLVECRVVESWLKDPEGLQQAEDRVRLRMHDEQFMYEASQRHWLDCGDHTFNARALMTNAGFYLDQGTSGSGEFAAWACRYLEAIKASSYLYDFSISFPWYLAIESEMARWGKLSPWVQYPSPHEVYGQLAGRRILLLTPFAEGLAMSHQSGRMQHLFHSFELPEFSLLTLPTPISTWPNRPDSSWQASAQRLADSAVAVIKREAIDLVLASCGCYGLPVLHDVHERTGAAAVYLGNYTNTLFGVLQNTSQDFWKENRREENWIRSDLSRVPFMDRIDGGRYL
jgi:hypothetical protein